MGMEMEYPFKMLLYIVVVIVLIGIMIAFRDKLKDICLVPPCEIEKKCNVETLTSSQATLSVAILDNYCNNCWIKNKNGECKENNVCYVVSLSSYFNPYSIGISSNDYCVIDQSCNKDVTSFFVEYDWINRKVSIKC